MNENDFIFENLVMEWHTRRLDDFICLVIKTEKFKVLRGILEELLLLQESRKLEYTNGELTECVLNLKSVLTFRRIYENIIQPYIKL